MDINILLLPSTECVYSLSGCFTESDSFLVAEDEVVYLTVFPLDAQFVPYTVKLIGASPKSNEGLAVSCRIGERDYAIKLGKRFTAVHYKDHRELSDDIRANFFYFVKGGHYNLAHELMSDELKEGLSDVNLKAFFDGFGELICVKGRYFLVDERGDGHPCGFALKNGKIDNITVD